MRHGSRGNGTGPPRSLLRSGGRRCSTGDCPGVSSGTPPDPGAVALLAQQPVGRVTLERGRGCAACRQTGYRGRIGIFELLLVNEEIQQQLLKTPNASALRGLAQAAGMLTLRHDGWRKVQAGLTTVEEVLRVTDQ